MTAYSWERDEWNRAHDSASDGDWHDPADRDVDPVEVIHVDAWHRCWQDADPWCPNCGPSLREWLRGREAS